MDAFERRKEDWENLDVTKEELENLKDCLQKDEFRKLLIEYAEEVTDPENRKTYEKEITLLEKERGVDVTFINPEPGYVIKTSLNGEKTCFVNISKSSIVARPSSQPSYEQGHRGLQWSIPYTLIPGREDIYKKNVRCTVFDVVFHPDTIYLSTKNAEFREMVNNIALDGVAKNFQVKLDRKNLKFPKMNYIGVCHPSVIRKPSKEPPPKDRLDIEPEIYQKLISSYDESREKQSKRAEKKQKRAPPRTTYYKEKSVKSEDSQSKYTTPTFSIKHQSEVEIQDFSIDKDAKMNATVPKKLIISINLPLLKHASDASLDVQEYFLSLRSEKPAKYFLELRLPYAVNAALGNARFDPKYKKLVVTLPVIRTTIPIPNAREDSGVDSEQNSPVAELINVPVTDSSHTSHWADHMPKLVEEHDTAFTKTVLEENSETVKECRDTALQTSCIDDADTFLNSSIKYCLPSFICNIYDSQLACTVNVKNVQTSSIRSRVLKNNSGVHIALTSLGAGFFPQHYSLCLKIAKDSVDPDSLSIEPWDNNVVFTITLNSMENLTHYYIGLNEEFMERKDFPTAAAFKSQLKELMATVDIQEDKNQNIDVQVQENDIVISVSSQIESEKERQDLKKSIPCQENERKPIIKSRSISESSDDELFGNGGNTAVLSKGILKSRRAYYSRSASESSTDEIGISISPSIDSQYGSTQDIYSESEISNLKNIEECDIAFAKTVLEENSESLKESRDTALQISCVDDSVTFLSSSIKYSLPSFICNIHDGQLACTINVKNVDTSSIQSRVLKNNSGVHITLMSPGAGFFPQHYSLCLKIAKDSVDPDSLSVEAWDNNVVFTITLKNTENLAHYYVGLNDEFMEQKDFPTATAFKNQLKELMAAVDIQEDKNQNIDVQVQENDVVISVSSQFKSEEEKQDSEESIPCQEYKRKPIIKSRSASESSGDEMFSNGNGTAVLPKGILKSRRANFSRSVSLSSADENVIPISTSIDSRYVSVQDVSSESESSSFKKSVRFNEIVSRQLFRPNSSILDQRKKKQRKMRKSERMNDE